MTGESRGEAELQHQGNSFVTSDEWGEIWAGLNNLPAHRGSHTCKCRPSMVWRGEPGPVDTARMERDAEDGARCGASSALCPSERQEVRVCPSLQPHVPNAMSLSWRERELQGPQAFPRRAQISCSQSLSQEHSAQISVCFVQEFSDFCSSPTQPQQHKPPPVPSVPQGQHCPKQGHSSNKNPQGPEITDPSAPSRCSVLGQRQDNLQHLPARSHAPCASSAASSRLRLLSDGAQLADACFLLLTAFCCWDEAARLDLGHGTTGEAGRCSAA